MFKISDKMCQDTQSAFGFAKISVDTSNQTEQPYWNSLALQTFSLFLCCN